MSTALPLLLDMSVKATLLGLLGFGLVRIARWRSAALRHDMWLASLACCALIPFVSAFALVNGAVWGMAPVHAAANVVIVALPPEAPSGAIAAVDRIWSGDGASPVPDWLGGLLLAAWLAGVAAAGLRSVRSHRAALAIVARASPVQMRDAPPGVALLSTPELSAPALFGWRSPAILLPAGAERWAGRRLRAVLAHEMAHVARRDVAFDLVVEIACALHWYNPLVLAAARRLRAEREMACDERVIAQGLDRGDYAETLVRIARRAGPGPRAALLAMAAQPELERRVRKILAAGGSAAAPAWLRSALAGAAVALFIPLAALTTPGAGVLAAGSVQPGEGPLSGLDDPMSERLPLPYPELARSAAAVSAAGKAAPAVTALRVHLDRLPKGHGDLVRERAIWTLVQVRDGRLFEPLAAKVGDSDWRVRAYAAWGLAASGDRRATPLLAKMLDDPVWRVRAMAGGGLARLADPKAAEAVLAAIDDPAWQVRLSAIDYVDEVGDPALARRLRPLLDDPHNGTRLMARAVLSRF